MARTSMVVFDCSTPAAPIPVASFGLKTNGDAGVSEADRYRLAGCFAVAEEATAVQVNLGEIGNLGGRKPK